MGRNKGLLIAIICLSSSCNAHFYRVQAPTTLTVKDSKDSVIMREQVHGKFVVNTKYLKKGTYIISIGDRNYRIRK
jgi:hypothetical protein